MLTERAFRRGSLCVVGNINRDVKTSPLPPGSYLFQDGETSASFVTETIGGGGANSAFAAAALGAEVTFIGRLGTDALGDRLERTLIEHGVTSHLARDKKNPTGTSIALAFENGHRHFVSCLPSCRALAFNDINLATMTARRHLLRADVWFPDAMLNGGNVRLFKAAHRSGMDVSLDLNWDPHWDRASRSEIKVRKLAVRESLPWVNLVHGNVRELTEFADASDLDMALERLVEWGAEAAVVHLGEKGAGYFDGKSLTIEPPAKAKRRFNTTGTGDVLSVCMILLHRHEKAPIRERLRLANKIVAQFIEGKGTFIPTLSD
jgi:sugar/nucleoside kinase (ribokinase family)